MRLLLVAPFGPGALAKCYERAFQVLNCEVIRFDETLHYQEVARWHRSKVVTRLFSWWVESRWNQRFLVAVKDVRPDLVLVLKGGLVLKKTLEEIKQLYKPVLFCFNPDDPFNTWHRGSSNKNIRSAIPVYDSYFIWSHKLIPSIKEAGSNDVRYLPFGFDPAIHYPQNPIELDPKVLRRDVVFVGNWDEERELWLNHLTDFDLAIWGAGYWYSRCKTPLLRKKWMGTPVYEEKMTEVFYGSRISINILRKQNKGAHNMRTFEAPACGVFTLAERSEEHLQFFVEGKEAEYFASPQELIDKIRYYLDHESKREEIAKRGYKRCIKSDYSYLSRSREVLKAYRGITDS
jgi:glycosyltransferase involved in cell wall biosynthesis